jgi:hypothetical protein
MILIWRGWGLLAIVALLLPLGSCVGLLDTRQGLAFVLGGLTLLGGGAACWVYGRRWNRPVTEHSLYFIPLQYWGWRTCSSAGSSPSAVWLGWFERACSGNAAPDATEQGRSATGGRD